MFGFNNVVLGKALGQHFAAIYRVQGERREATRVRLSRRGGGGGGGISMPASDRHIRRYVGTHVSGIFLGRM